MPASAITSSVCLLQKSSLLRFSQHPNPASGKCSPQSLTRDQQNFSAQVKNPFSRGIQLKYCISKKKNLLKMFGYLVRRIPLTVRQDPWVEKTLHSSDCSAENLLEWVNYQSFFDWLFLEMKVVFLWQTKNTNNNLRPKKLLKTVGSSR